MFIARRDDDICVMSSNVGRNFKGELLSVGWTLLTKNQHLNIQWCIYLVDQISKGEQFQHLPLPTFLIMGNQVKRNRNKYVRKLVNLKLNCFRLGVMFQNYNRRVSPYF